MRPLKYKLVSLQELRVKLNILKPVAFDVETDDFYGPICLAQFYQEGWDEALLVKTPDIIGLISILKPLHIICHNTSYEVSTIQDRLGMVFMEKCHKWEPAKWDDTLLLSKLKYFKAEKFSLDMCYQYAFKTDPYINEGLDKKAMQKSNWVGELSEDQLKYAATDVFYLLDLYEACSDFHDSSSYNLDKVATDKAFGFQTNGLAINPKLIQDKIEANDIAITALDMPINVNSWQQTRPYIGENESDGLALATFALNGNDRARDVRECRRLIKQNSFLNKFLNESFEDRIYGKFTFTTKSGRGNCKDQNLQQLPRATKDVFQVPEGRKLVISDFSQLELRYGCALANETVMEELFKSGADLHQYTADMMGSSRQVAKTLNFNLLYGGSAGMLQSIFIKDVGIFLPIEEVRALKAAWHKLWPNLTRWQELTTSDWREGRTQHTLMGRKFKSKLYTDAMNLPVQGGSADIAKLAMHRMMTKIKASVDLRSQAQMVNFVHDSFIFECGDNEDIYKPLSQIIADSMQSAWHELSQHLPISDIPMPVEVLVGDNWGNLDYGKETPTYKLEQ